LQRQLLQFESQPSLQREVKKKKQDNTMSNRTKGNKEKIKTKKIPVVRAWLAEMQAIVTVCAGTPRGIPAPNEAWKKSSERDEKKKAKISFL
jgi:hypothetical protein